jgi:outer membrane receptor protein involved in Fe transport
MKGGVFLLAVSTLALSAPAAAQDASQHPSTTDAPLAQDGEPGSEESGDIVVTAVARGQNRLNSSVSVSSLGQEEIQKIAPRSVAEVFRNIPGIRSESSGGEGNANIAVRGLPVASGGAKFLQLQEDGLPILEYGDITFGNADIFLRSDLNIARVEAVRGGSASTFASNSPGGVINLISKTGETTGGSVLGTIGLDYGEYRIDADYGGRLSDTLRFHVGGFYRQGEGPREAGYDGNKGGQIKANITKEFRDGYLRVFAKYLNDRAIGYLPNPVRVTGSNGDPEYQNLPGFRINGDTLHSRFFTRNVTLDDNNRPTSNDIREGQRPVVFSAGFELQSGFGDGWSVTNRFRFSDISGRFISNFPAAVDTAANTAATLGGAGSPARYANGPNAGQAVAGNQLLAQIVVFDTKLNSLDNIINDLRLNKEFAVGRGTVNLLGGFYASRQRIDTAWLWTSALLEVRGGGEAALVDVRGPAGQLVTQDGFYGYGARFFGNCCRRRYDLTYDTYAPFASGSFEGGGLTIDGSLRYDFGNADGRVFGSDLGGGRVGITIFDINGNGTIAPPETQVAVIPYGQPGRVDYDWDYLSYSLGANYRLRDDLSVFGRYSRGARTNADRLLFGPSVDPTSGRLVSSDAAVDFVKQAEGGLKFRRGGVALFATGFYAETEEQNFEATTQRFFDRNYRAYGVELEGSVRSGIFSLSAGGTYTNAEITRDAINPAVVGNRPRRQAEFLYQVTPQIDTDRFTAGANIVGTTDSFAQDNNQLRLPGFTQVNAFAQVRLIDRIQLSVNANNLFDVSGFTEAEEGAIPANGIVRARSINGRTVSASIRLDF